ncbi:MAG: DUF6364 family protein [Phormidium sp.]
MQTKLTLRLDETLIAKAKNWAKSRNVSLSEAVAEFFEHLPEPDRSLQLTTWTQSLVGVIKSTGEIPNDEALREEYIDYLEEKYQ